MPVSETTPKIDLGHARRIHIVGIGGSGMSAIALVLASMGHRVSGSDAAESAVWASLKAAGISVSAGHAADRLPLDVEAVALSTAIPAENPEAVEARRRGIPVLRRADLLAAIAATRRTIAIAGTHGKTTTSTLTALVLEGAQQRPSWIIGGEIVGRGAGAKWDTGPWFVVEADESDGTFLELGAEAVVVTNVEPDHLEFYGGWEGLVAAFEKFVQQTPGPKVVCADDAGAARLAEQFGCTTYGRAESADYRILNLELGRFDTAFDIRHGDETAHVQLRAPGMHNVLNATAAIAVGDQIGIPMEAGAVALTAYAGVGRRFQRRGEREGVTFVDDYAHLPSEVKASVSAALDGDWTRVVAVFQPHRYSRTEQVGADFGGSFDGVDMLVLTDVYAAGEPPRPGVSGSIVRKAVEAGPGHPPILYVTDRDGLALEVANLLRPGDLCLTLGAGDITKLADEILELP